MATGLFDDLVPATSNDPFSDIGAAPGFTPGDYLKGLKRGVQQIPGSLTGLVDVPGALLTGERYADKAADTLGQATGFKPGQWAKDTRLSPGGEAAMQELDTAWKKSGADRLGSALLGNFDDLPEAWRQADLGAAGKAIIEHPGAAAMNVVESIPGMLVGGGIGKGLAVAGKVAPVIAGAAGEGLITAGQQMDQTDRSADPRTAAATSLAAGAGTGLIAGVGGKVAQRLGLEDVQTAMAGGRADDVGRGMVGRLGGGAVAEAGQEFLQSGQEQAWQNAAEGNPLGQGVVRSAVEGAIAGAVMGGGANLLPERPQQPVVVPRQDGMGDAVIDPATGPISSAAADHIGRTQTDADLFGDLMPADPLASAIEPPVDVPESADPFVDLIPDQTLQPATSAHQAADPLADQVNALPDNERRALAKRLGVTGFVTSQNAAGKILDEHPDDIARALAGDTWNGKTWQPAAAPQGWDGFLTGDRVTTKAGTVGTLSFDKSGTVATVTPDTLADGSTNVKGQGVFSVTPGEVTKTIDQAASLANVAPTEAQIAAGNYQKGHIKVGPLDIAVENPVGSTRTGPGWQTTMQAHYGYLKRTTGADGDQVDVYVKTGTPTDHTGPVYVVDQFDPKTGKFDEHKALVGYTNQAEAVAAYDAHFGDGTGPQRRRGVVQMSAEQFKQWAQEGDTRKPVAQPTRIEDFGEKIGGARKDLARPTGPKSKALPTPIETEPTWQRRFTPMQNLLRSDETWNLIDTKTGKPIRGAEFKSEQATKDAIPLIAVAQKHRVVAVKDGFEIMRDVTDRKRVKVVDQVFPTRDAAMTHMASHAQAIIETKTSFREELFARPEKVMRDGTQRRTSNATAEDFGKTFGFRGVEFGLWNNQDERQEVMNHAFDGLLDLADVLGVPPKALSLNGDLALAFGARGQGLSGAIAHYERGHAVINLTKMQGAGALAHEWFHALDHYFGRQDGKASSAKVQNKRGDTVFETDGPGDYASHGLSLKSAMRDELQTRYKSLIQTLFTKAEQYVEDTEKAERFVGSTRDTLVKSLTTMRKQLEKAPEWQKRNNKPATAEQLAEFDQLAADLVEGRAFQLDTRSSQPKKGQRFGTIRLSNDQLDALSDLFKAVRGRSGMNAEGTGVVDGLRSDLRRYAERVRMLDDARAGNEKTKRVPTEFAMDAKRIDQGSATDYWTTPHEMAARAFSAYVEDKVPGRSDFLSYGSDNSLAQYRLFNVRPFPEGAEREAIGQAFDAFLGALKTRKTATGVELYSLIDRDKRVASFNRAANEQIEAWASGTLKSSAIIEMGHPSSVLLKFGMPDLPMHLTQAVLRKAVVQKHDVDAADLKDITLNVQAPIAVFGSKRGQGHLVVVTEARHADGNIVVALDLDVQRDGIGINDVRSIHPKRDESVVHWITDGLLLGVEKRKGRDWLENSAGSNSQQPQVKAALDKATIYDVDAIRNAQPDAAQAQFDQLLYTMAEAPWGDTSTILTAIEQGSASAFNRELAKLLREQNLKTTIQVVPFDGEHAGGYRRQTDVISIGLAADAEQTIIHELMHAATSRALSNKSVAVGAMRALLKEVRGHLGIYSHYGLSSPHEFVAEAFANPEFQQALRQIPVKASGIRGKIADAWGRFVSTVRQLLGLDRDQETALGKALELGVRLMKENPTAPLRDYMGEIVHRRAKRDAASDRLTVRDWLTHQLANQRSWALGALTRDQLADIYGKQMPEVADFDRVVQQMDQARNVIAERADEIVERWRKLPAKVSDALADLMHQATLHAFDPDTKGRSDIVFPEHDILLKDWAALPDDAKAIYREVRDRYQATLVQLRNGLAKRADRAGAKATAAEIRLQFDKYLSEGPYFPLARFGDFILIAEKHGERTVEAFESSAAREKRARGLRVQGWTTKLTARKAYSAASDGPSGEFAGKVLKLVGGLEIDAKEKAGLMDSLNQLAIGALPDQSYRKHFSHRKGVPGFSQDAMRAFASSMQHVAHHVARVQHGDELQLLVDGLNKRASQTIGDVDVTAMAQVANELAKRLELMMNPNTHPVTAALGQVGFVMSLGGSIASGITNLSQTPLITFPWLGAKFGFDNAAGGLMKASKDYFGGKWDKWSGFVLKDNQALTADERRALQQLEDQGLINLTQTSDLASTATTDSASSQRSWAINRAMKVIGWTFSVPEIANRQVSALAAYRLAVEKGQSHDQALEGAAQTLRRTHFDYSASNRARWMAGNFVRVISMFKQYSQQMSYLLWRNAHQALKGESPEVRREARRMLLGVAVMHFAAAGALGLPLGVFGVTPLLGLLAMGMGSDDAPWDWEVEFRNLLADLFGKQAGEAIAHGPLRTLTGIDMAGRVGLGDLWVPAPQGDKEGRDLVEAWMLTLLGPVAGYVGNLGTAVKAFDEGKPGRGLEAMLPKMLAAPIKAARYETEGVKSWRGDDLGVALTGGDILGTALGFNPSKVAEMFEGQRAIKGRESALVGRREEIANMFTAAALAGDTAMQAEAIKAAQAFSLRNPSMALSADSLRKSLQAKVRNQALIRDGVYLSKRRQDLRAEGRFANVE